MIGAVKREYENVEEMRRLILQLTGTERDTHRQQRVIVYLVVHVAHSLFGTLDSESSTFYIQNLLS
jgi:hypothetical protein